VERDIVRDGAGYFAAICPGGTRRLPLLWFCGWMIAFACTERDADDATDWMRPPAWSGNFWGPAASRARLAGQLPPLPVTPAMARWGDWGRRVLREGDIVFRLGDARALRGILPLSSFIARATGSPFSHTAIVAIEEGSPVVYDASSEGIRRLPFEAWMVECVGPMDVKRPKPNYRDRIPGVIGYCRKLFEKQVPFDYEFSLDDDSFYCLELTEKAFRSQGMALSEPVRIGDWEYLMRYPVIALGIPVVSRLMLDRPITLEQSVYLPGNEHQGVWASPLLETVFGPEPKWDRVAALGPPGRLSFSGDLEVAFFAAGELRRSYSQLPVRWICSLALQTRKKELVAHGPERRPASLNK
jgi:Permuted papain-like amidase enzyme, YaeF/YiiX, C92 family